MSPSVEIYAEAVAWGENSKKYYCPRCDKETPWVNRATVPYKRLGCLRCEIEEGDLMTPEEQGRLEAHASTG